MVSALGSRSRGLGSRPGRVDVLCSRAKHFTLTVPLFGELSGKPSDGLSFHPAGNIITPLVTSCYLKIGISSFWVGHGQ